MGFFEAVLSPHAWMLILDRINSVFTNWDTPMVRILVVLIGCAGLCKLLNLFEPPCPICNGDDADADLSG